MYNLISTLAKTVEQSYGLYVGFMYVQQLV
jgi:hypothetical protein